MLVGVVLVIQGLTAAKLPARWRFALWWLVLIRLVLPFGPGSRWSLFNLTPLQAPAVSVTPLVGTALAVVWAAGILGVVGRIVWENQRLAFAVVRRRSVTDAAVLDVLEDCRALMRIHTPVAIVETPHVSSPALHGFIRPRLLVPPGLLRTFSREELRFVILHELAHLQRHDIAVGWLLAALQALHWFNPVIWVAFLRMRADRELAADELALWYAKPTENRAYAETIIKLLETCSGRLTVPTLVGILEDRSHMTRRIRRGGVKTETGGADAL